MSAYLENGMGETAMPSPLDVVKHSTEVTSGSKPLRWGIMGAGRVCHDFVQALKSIPESAVAQAVGCRDMDRSNEFADLHGIPNRHSSYEDVSQDPEVEICYVGMLHPFHYEAALTALRNGKHVLVEKPFTCNIAHTHELIRVAQEKGLFVMEGMWTRFFPAVEKARQVIQSGVLGDVVAVHSDFGFNSTDVADYPDHLFYNLKLGGGGLYYVAPYPIAAAVQALGPGLPTRIAAAGVKDKLTGVDMSGAIALHFEDRGIASLTYNLQGESAEETMVVGTKGRLKILTPAHCPTALEVTSKRAGRGNVETVRYDYPLPTPPAAVEEAGGFHYPNSNGFQYEAAAVHRCIRAGLTSCPQYPPEEIITVLHIMEECRKQLGVEAV